MTAQSYEELILNGEHLMMFAEPLSEYLKETGNDEIFTWTMTACLRGYFGTWQVNEERLYLIGLSGSLATGGQANLASLFPDQPDGVFAVWYSGVIRCPRGERLQYVHMSYLSQYEEDLFLEFEKGVLVKQWVVDNRT
ncbi:conserved hypothetical protein [Rhodospirillaceae bacterium LM-1]|nr:conserved hypothetical protein [Rhodospirillaceae bacterium LM-1]